MKNYITLIMISFICVLYAEVYANETVHLNERNEFYILGDKIEILEDPANSITINDILYKKFDGKFIKSNNQVPSIGFSDSYFWIKFNISSDFYNDQDIFDFVLELANPHFDFVEIFIFDSEGRLSHLKTGDSLPFHTRSINHRFILFNIKTHKGLKQSVFINIKTSGAFYLPLYLMTLNKFIINEQINSIFYGIFFGILIMMCIGSFVIFFIEFDKQYLAYSFFILAILAVEATFAGFAFQLFWPEQPELSNIAMPVLLIFATIALLNFSKHFITSYKKNDFLKKIISALIIINILLGIVFVVIDYSMAIQISTYNSAIIAILLLMIGLYKSLRESRSARYFSLAMSLFLIGTIVIVFTQSGILPHVWITDRAQQIGLFFQSSIFFIALTERFTELSKMKSEAEESAQREREKYKIIVEESDDIYFTVDNNWNILSANKAMKRHLKISLSEVDQINLLDLIYEEDKTERIESTQLLHEKLERFLQDKKSINFKALLKTSFVGEPVEFNIQLEYIKINGRTEILGRAINIIEDSLMRYFVNEKQKFIIENFLITADDIARRITRNLPRYVNLNDVNPIRIALREIIINAIEHGNLEISFEEKSQSLELDEYFSLIEKRRKDKQHAGKKVAIDYSLDEEKVKYRITDEGRGFNYRQFIKKNADKVNSEELGHGRGLSMAKNVFDEILFNKKGNQILLVKYFYK